MGLKEMLQLTANMGPMMDQMGPSVNAVVGQFERIANFLEIIAKLLAPATAGATFNQSTNPVSANTATLGPIPFVSRWVDISCSAASTAGISVTFFDENAQQLGVSGINIAPGESRSYAVVSREITVTSSGAPIYTVVFWT